MEGCWAKIWETVWTRKHTSIYSIFVKVPHSLFFHVLKIRLLDCLKIMRRFSLIQRSHPVTMTPRSRKSKRWDDNKFTIQCLSWVFWFYILLYKIQSQVQSFLRGWICRRKWKTIIQDYIRSPHAESMRKRNQVVFSMLEAEAEYVQQLHILVNNFLRPLRMAASSKKPPITHDDVSSIFLNRWLVVRHDRVKNEQEHIREC